VKKSRFVFPCFYRSFELFPTPGWFWKQLLKKQLSSKLSRPAFSRKSKGFGSPGSLSHLWIFAPPVTQKSRLSGLLAAKAASEFAG
jgi:hypothetical protein